MHALRNLFDLNVLKKAFRSFVSFINLKEQLTKLLGRFGLLVAQINRFLLSAVQNGLSFSLVQLIDKSLVLISGFFLLLESENLINLQISE